MESTPLQASPDKLPTRTATGNLTAASSIGVERERWSDDEHFGDDDEDAGMFTFLRPTTAANAPSGALHSPMRIHSATSSEPSSLVQTRLSSAAAYAIASQQPSLNQTSSQGERQRGSWLHQRKEAQGDGSDRGDLSTADSSANRQWDGKSATSSELGYSGDQSIQMQQLGRDGGVTRAEDDKIAKTAYEYSSEQLAFEAFMDDEEDSPYPEVRASVSNIDDTEMPCLTFRSWFLGLFFTITVGAMNVFFFFRYPSPSITPIIVQVVSYPAGKLLAWILPTTTWTVPKRLRSILGDEVSLNPGPFNIKEHTIIIIMANCATAPAYGLNFSIVSEKYYGISQGPGFDILLLLTTQMLGFGMAGLCRRFLVWPASLIWPNDLVYCTLLNTLHAEDDDGTEGGDYPISFLRLRILRRILLVLLPK